MGNKKRNFSLPYSQWATRSEMFRFHSHNTYILYICTTIVVLVKEAKLLASIQTMDNKKRNVSLPPSHNTYICTIVVLVKEAKLLASIQTMGNKKRNVSLPPSHNTYICTIYVVLVKEAKLLASIQTMGNKKRNVSLPFPQHIYMYNIRCVSKRSETSRFHTDNGQQEAKCFASIPTTHIYVQYTLC